MVSVPKILNFPNSLIWSNQKTLHESTEFETFCLNCEITVPINLNISSKFWQLKDWNQSSVLSVEEMLKIYAEWILQPATSSQKNYTPCQNWTILFITTVSQYMWAVQKVSIHSEFLENWLHGLDATWQPVRDDLTVHLWTVTLLWG
jgi:hypothetical protein